jgi:hypothetical protein
MDSGIGPDTEEEIMTRTPRPIEKGDRFESQDTRDAGRIIKVVETVVDVVGDMPAEPVSIPSPGLPDDVIPDPVLETEREYLVEVTVHPDNPDAVGHTYRIGEATLRNRKHYRRVSR